MIFIDYNNSAIRNYSVAINLVLPDFNKRYKINSSIEIKEEQYKTIRKAFYNLMINELTSTKLKYKDYGRLLVASDYDKSKYWRKRHFNLYKVKDIKEDKVHDMLYKNFNKDKLDLLGLFKLMNIFVLDKIEVNGSTAEADDTIFVLSQLEGKHLIYSTDKDYTQVLNSNVKQYHPFQRKILETPSNREKMNFMLESCVMGQAKDNIKPITYETEISDEFIKWSKNKYDLDITKDMILILKEKYSYYMEEYKNEMREIDEKEIKSGKRKQRRNLTAYKKTNLGEVNCKKFIENFDENMKNPLYVKNFNINQKLMLFNHIDEDIKEKILEEYNKLFIQKDIFEKLEDENKIYNFIVENDIIESTENINKLKY